MTYTINALSDFNKLRRRKDLKGFHRIALGGNLPFTNKTEIESKINDYYFACGCDTGAIVLAIALALFIISSAISYLMFNSLDPKMMTAGLLAVIAAAGLAKMIGIWAARKKLYNLLDKIEDRR